MIALYVTYLSKSSERERFPPQTTKLSLPVYNDPHCTIVILAD